MARKNAMINRSTVQGKQASGGISKKSPGKSFITISELKKISERVANFSRDDSKSLHKVIKHFVNVNVLSCVVEVFYLLVLQFQTRIKGNCQRQYQQH
jgi:hypothetical protein